MTNNIFLKWRTLYSSSMWNRMGSCNVFFFNFLREKSLTIWQWTSRSKKVKCPMLVSLSGDHFIKKNEHLQADERAQCGLHPSQVANFCNDAKGSKKRYAHLDFKEGMVSEFIVGCTRRLSQPLQWSQSQQELTNTTVFWSGITYYKPLTSVIEQILNGLQ